MPLELVNPKLTPEAAAIEPEKLPTLFVHEKLDDAKLVSTIAGATV